MTRARRALACRHSVNHSISVPVPSTAVCIAAAERDFCTGPVYRDKPCAEICCAAAAQAAPEDTAAELHTSYCLPELLLRCSAQNAEIRVSLGCMQCLLLHAPCLHNSAYWRAYSLCAAAEPPGSILVGHRAWLECASQALCSQRRLAVSPAAAHELRNGWCHCRRAHGLYSAAEWPGSALSKHRARLRHLSQVLCL